MLRRTKPIITEAMAIIHITRLVKIFRATSPTVTLRSGSPLPASPVSKAA